MNKNFHLLCLCGLLTFTIHVRAQQQDKPYPDPSRFEREIRAFEWQDSLQMPPPDAIVCTGSSSMRMWHDRIAEDLAPLTVIPRGFGGSNMHDLLYYSDRIVVKYHPRAVVVYEGDNDIAQGIPPEKIRDTFIAFVQKVQQTSPECRIYFISVKPSLARWNLWPQMKETNRLIAEVCAKDSALTFIDVVTGMLGEDGKPKREIFIDDGLHMNRAGYLIWKEAIRPVLMQKEL